MNTTFSSLGIVAGGNPTTNTTRWMNALANIKSRAAPVTTFVIDNSIKPYDFDNTTPFNIALQNLAIIAEGHQATLRHTGSGQFIVANGWSNFGIGRDAVKRVLLGTEDQPIQLKGNPRGGTTDVFYINRMADSKFHIRPRDGVTQVRADNVGQTNTFIAMVTCLLDVTVSPDWDEEPFHQPAVSGAMLNSCFGCDLRLNIEGIGWFGGSRVNGAQYATTLDNSNRNWFRGRASMESNGAGGVWITSTCQDNTVEPCDNEVNGGGVVATGSGYCDWVIRGTRTRLCSIAGLAQIDGAQTIAEGCTFEPGTTVCSQGPAPRRSDGTVIRHSFQSCQLDGWNDVGASSWVRNCDVSDPN